MGAQYGPGLNRLSQAVFALLARLYADAPDTPTNLTTKERNELSRKQHAERNQRIRQLFATGKTLQELATQFGISTTRVSQIIHSKRK